MGMAPNLYMRICFALLYVYVNVIRVQSYDCPRAIEISLMLKRDKSGQYKTVVKYSKHKPWAYSVSGLYKRSQRQEHTI